MSRQYCVIMAGGVGSRFWPLSRQNKPKQFLDILGVGSSLLQQTYERVSAICPDTNIYIVTNENYVDLVKEQLPSIPVDNILAEPDRRNTAPCIAYAAYKIIKKDPQANMLVTPADHFILDNDKFIETVNAGLNFVAENDVLLTLGIKPTRPETGYGYIQIEQENKQSIGNVDVYKVKTFTEKPDLKMATIFYESGEFYWNAGIFLWKVQTILDAFVKYMPEMIDEFDRIKGDLDTEREKASIADVYSKIQSISIDYGVMEKAENVFVIPSSFRWSDLGTWGALYENSADKDDNGNVKVGNVMTYNTKNSLINTPEKRLVVVQGLENVIIAESDNMLLITTMKDEQFIRQIVNDIRLEKGEDFV